jgi:hypothetical protein
MVIAMVRHLITGKMQYIKATTWTPNIFEATKFETKEEARHAFNRHLSAEFGRTDFFKRMYSPLEIVEL